MTYGPPSYPIEVQNATRNQPVTLVPPSYTSAIRMTPNNTGFPAYKPPVTANVWDSGLTGTVRTVFGANPYQVSPNTNKPTSSGIIVGYGTPSAGGTLPTTMPAQATGTSNAFTGGGPPTATTGPAVVGNALKPPGVSTASPPSQQNVSASNTNIQSYGMWPLVGVAAIILAAWRWG